jgi:hypothetical protein
VIVVVKTANVGTFSTTGKSIKYKYVVTNSSTNDVLGTVTVSDPMKGLSAIKCGKGGDVIKSLGAGASVTCTASYRTTEGDLNAGSIINTAVVKGTDTGGTTITGTSNTVVISYNGVQILTSSVAVAAEGSPYYAPLVATGGTGLYKWSKVAGSLPGGVTLSSMGYVSGTPTENGTYTFTVKVSGTGTTKQSPTEVLSLVVSPSIPVISSVVPSTGPAGGGTKVTITGTGLKGTKVVMFGSQPGTKVTVAKSGTSLVVVTPRGIAGSTVDVTLTTAGDSATYGDAFTYH